jgi:hypothetical protein
MTFKIRRSEIVFTLDENMEASVDQIGEDKYIVTFVNYNTQKKTMVTTEPITQPIPETDDTLEHETIQTKTIKIPIKENKRNKTELPEIDDVIKYFKSFDDITKITFNNSELRETLMGRSVNSTNENYLYQRLSEVVDKAKDTFAIEENGHWEEMGRVSLGHNRRPMSFRFVRNEINNN